LRESVELFSRRSLVGGARREHTTGHFAPDLPAVDTVLDAARAADFRATWGAGQGAPLIVEVGFARPLFLTASARLRPHARFLGFEIRSRWCFQLLNAVARHDLANVRLVRGDFREWAGDLLAPGSVTALAVHFPDPWWKPRHERRRLVDDAFVRAATVLLVPGGFVSFRTDVPWYFDMVRDAFEASGAFTEGAEPAWCAALPSHRQGVCLREGVPFQTAGFFRTSAGVGDGVGGGMREGTFPSSTPSPRSGTAPSGNNSHPTGGKG